MSETTDLETLLRLMPPVTPSDTQVDWDRLAATWGRQFPPPTGASSRRTGRAPSRTIW